MVYNTIQHPFPPHPPHPHTVCIYCTFRLGRGKGGGGGGGLREGRGATVNKYSSFVLRDNSSQAGLKIPTMSEYISSL
jgi:hypothetical protein